MSNYILFAASVDEMSANYALLNKHFVITTADNILVYWSKLKRFKQDHSPSELFTRTIDRYANRLNEPKDFLWLETLGYVGKTALIILNGSEPEEMAMFMRQVKDTVDKYTFVKFLPDDRMLIISACFCCRSSV